MEFPQAFLSLIFIIAGAANFGGVAAQSSGCATSLVTLSPCTGYITSNVTASPPPQSCCTALSSVVQSNAVCLCQLLTANNPIGFPINQTRALALPGACKITTPPLTQCKVVGAPAPAPSAAAGSSNGVSPVTETAPSSSPATPNAVSPSSNSPSLLPPTNSVGGISPTKSERPTSKAGALFTPSMIISALAVAMVASSMW